MRCLFVSGLALALILLALPVPVTSRAESADATFPTFEMR